MEPFEFGAVDLQACEPGPFAGLKINVVATVPAPGNDDVPVGGYDPFVTLIGKGMGDMPPVAENELQGLDLTGVETDLKVPLETAVIPVERKTGGKGNGADAALPNGLRNIPKELTAVVRELIFPKSGLSAITHGGGDVSEHVPCGKRFYVNA